MNQPKQAVKARALPDVGYATEAEPQIGNVYVEIMGAKPEASDDPNSVKFVLENVVVTDLSPLGESFFKAVDEFVAGHKLSIGHNAIEDAVDSALSVIHTELLARVIAQRIKR